MGQKYQSRWTGEQIDRAIRKVLKGKVTLEDLDPSLQASFTAASKLIFTNHYEFPSVGAENTLYIAQDEGLLYFWAEDRYVAFHADLSNIDTIDCGGAQHGESDAQN